MNFLFGSRCSREKGATCYGGESRANKPPRDRRIVVAGHVNKQCRITRRVVAPIPGFSGGPMSRSENEIRRNVPMRQRNARGGGGPECRGNSGDNFILDIYTPQGLNLFAGAAKDQRIPALQPNDLQPRV